MNPRTFVVSSTLLFVFCALPGCASRHAGNQPARPGLPSEASAQPNPVHHPVSTSNPEAQRWFDRGLALVYAFNHDEAVKAFERAAAADPKLAMAHWGIGLAKGPNINMDVEPEQEKAAYEATQKALALSANAPEPERAYALALAKRYSAKQGADLQALAVDYKTAMGELSRRFPDDLDAATLYAESAMDLRPWKLWKPTGEPEEGTTEIVATLESVLARDPNHVGANHYYIHAVEASPHPEKALPCAARLKTLLPEGHLVHMPAHVYSRTGDFDAAARANADAAEIDRAYIRRTGARGVYPMMYYSHNLHFLAYARAMEGRYADAAAAARQLADHVSPHVKHMPMLEGFLPTPMLVTARCQRWDDVLASPRPDDSLPTTLALWHFARGLAFAAKGDAKSAEVERAALVSAAKALPADAMFGPLNKSSDLMAIAVGMLDGKIAAANGDRAAAAARLRQAVEVDDRLSYDEPPAWYLYPRESLGAVLLLDGRAGEAEKVFREDLARHRRNGRSLFGLMKALEAQGKAYDAGLVRMQFQEAWANADTTLRIEGL